MPRYCSNCAEEWDDAAPHAHGVPIRDGCERCGGYGRIDPLHGGPAHAAFDPAYCVPCPDCANPALTDDDNVTV